MAKKELDSVTKKAARQGLLVVIVAVITLEATAVLQYFYSRHILSEEATRRAEGQLAATELHIANVVDQVETAVRNSIWSVSGGHYRAPGREQSGYLWLHGGPGREGPGPVFLPE